MKISEHASVCALDENKVRCTVPAEEVARIAEENWPAPAPAQVERIAPAPLRTKPEL